MLRCYFGASLGPNFYFLSIFLSFSLNFSSFLHFSDDMEHVLTLCYLWAHEYAGWSENSVAKSKNRQENWKPKIFLFSGCQLSRAVAKSTISHHTHHKMSGKSRKSGKIWSFSEFFRRFEGARPELRLFWEIRWRKCFLKWFFRIKVNFLQLSYVEFSTNCKSTWISAPESVAAPHEDCSHRFQSPIISRNFHAFLDSVCPSLYGIRPTPLTCNIFRIFWSENWKNVGKSLEFQQEILDFDRILQYIGENFNFLAFTIKKRLRLHFWVDFFLRNYVCEKWILTLFFNRF